MQGLSFRTMRPSDLETVVRIERLSFDTPWERRVFARHLQDEGTHCYVAVKGPRIVAYAALGFSEGTARLLNFAVEPAYRRKGAGSQFMESLFRFCQHHDCVRLEVEVRESNLGAQLFGRTVGFRATKVLRKHFEDTGEDAYLMQHTIDAASKVGE